MRLNKKNNVLFTNIAKSQGATPRGVLKECFRRKISISEIADHLGRNYNTVYGVLHGVFWSPKILVDADNYLLLKKDPLHIDGLMKLNKHEKSLDWLIQNGFSYWEAVRIAQD